MRKTMTAVLIAAATMIPAVAQAQCPVGALCFFGTDVGGSDDTRATNVNSILARNEFFSNLIGVGTESFESLAAGTTNPALVFPGAGTANLTGGGEVESFTGAGANGAGRYPTNGTRFYEATSSSGGTTFTINFLSPVAAFGFYGIDIGDQASQLSLLFTLVGGGTQTWVLPYTASDGRNSARDGSLLYSGFINTAGFTSVSFRGTDGADVFAFDEMTIGSIEQVQPPSTMVPEPSTVLLLGAGLAAMTLAARRRRRA